MLFIVLYMQLNIHFVQGIKYFFPSSGKESMIKSIFFCDRYRGIDENNKMIIWLWKVLETFTNDERIQFLRFVSGRTRMPANPADISQRFQIISSGRVSCMDTFLQTSAFIPLSQNEDF